MSTRLLWALPPLAWLLAMHGGPFAGTVWVSLLDRYPAPPGASPAFSPAAYTALANGPGYLAALGRSLGLAAAATVLSLLIAFPLAFHIALRVPPARRLSRVVLLAAPFWAGEVVRTAALAALLSRNGPVNALLRAAGLGTAPLLYGSGSVLLGTVYTVLLSALLPLYAALDRLPPALLDAAADLGAGPWLRLRTIVLPCAARGIGSAAALCFLASLGLLAPPSLLGGPGAPVFATTIAGLFTGSTGRWPQGAAFGLVLLAAGLLCAAPLALLGRRRSA